MPPALRISMRAFAASLAVTAATAAEPPAVSALFKEYCVECHGPKKQKGDFRVDELRISQNLADAEKWRLVLDNLHLGEMPPEDAKQPKLADVEPVTAWIEAELQRASLALSGEKGEVVLRRLNRFEFQNTIEDLFEVRGDYALGFPEDATSGGFNTNGAALSLSAEQMAEYLRAADYVLNRAIVTTPRPETKLVGFTLTELDALRKSRELSYQQKRKVDNLTAQEKKDRENVLATIGTRPSVFPAYHEDALIPTRYAKPDTKDFFQVRFPGWYRFRTVAYAVRNEGAPIRLEVSHGFGNFEEVPTIAGTVQLTDETPRDVEYRVYLQPNQRVQLRMLDGKEWLPVEKVLEDKSPAAAIRRIEMEGPLIDQWPPRGHQALLGPLDAAKLDDAAVPGLLRDLAPQLFRRPVEARVIDGFIAFYQAQRAEGPALEAYKLTVKAMMTSPLFLFHYEPSGPLDDYGLANRLAYFLWCSMPDAELLALAANGKLSRPAELKKQTERLLADPKAERFLKDFTGQWLQTKKVGEMQPDKTLYPEYDQDLERAMVQETQLFIREMLVHDLSLRNLVDSDWTMLNDRLARHYGIEGVQGNEFRKVQLDKSKTVRGGLLTQASILTITSNGTTTSPVVRGVWLLDHLLGTPSPPPPPDVPAIEPDIRGATTMQEQLAKHRTIAQCAACHRKIDPFGFALENFDVIGGWRENYRALVQEKGRQRPRRGEGKPVLAADELPKLGAFKDFAAFRALLLKNEPLVYRNTAEKLATYALGRRMSFADRADIDGIVKTTKANGGGLRTMLMTFIQSPLFKRP